MNAPRDDWAAAYLPSPTLERPRWPTWGRIAHAALSLIAITLAGSALILATIVFSQGAAH